MQSSVRDWATTSPTGRPSPRVSGHHAWLSHRQRTTASRAASPPAWRGSRTSQDELHRAGAGLAGRGQPTARVAPTHSGRPQRRTLGPRWRGHDASQRRSVAAAVHGCGCRSGLKRLPAGTRDQAGESAAAVQATAGPSSSSLHGAAGGSATTGSATSQVFFQKCCVGRHARYTVPLRRVIPCAAS